MEGVRLQDRADRADRIHELGVVTAENRRVAARRMEERDEGAQSGRLAGAVRPEKAGHAAGLGPEGQIVDREDLPVALGEARDLDQERVVT